MFLLAVIEDKLRTLPDQFARDSEAVLLDQIDIKFANKVLVDVGLCITLFDFLEVGDPYIYPAEGSAHQRVKFRMVVFRPFVGEVRCLRRRHPLHCR
jgi:DNA-directed RNA polymerase III subunit RPC8